MQLSSVPAKFLIPFARDAASANFTELPATTSDATRASQSLGFPPLTMQPRLAGGEPAQGPDVNGGMNQIARTAWWLMAGAKYLYDSTWAANINIGGYPAGAQILTADGSRVVQSRVNDNLSAPTGSTGNWGPATNPGYEIASPGATVTLTDQQAASSYVRVTGSVAAPCTITLQQNGGAAPLAFVFAHDGTGSNVTLTTGVGANLVAIAGQRLNVRQRNDGSLFDANTFAGGGGGGGTTPITVGSAGAAHGTISMQDHIYTSYGTLRQWVTMQLDSPGPGPAPDTWTYPIPFTTNVFSIRGTNLSRPAGQVYVGGAEGAVLCGALPGLTSVALACEGTSSTGAVCWFLVEVEGI
jgi:hypothetical protein